MSIVKFKHIPVNSFNNLMEDFLPQLPSLFRDETGGNFGQAAPVNIKETEKGYELEIIAPGFTKEDFKVSLEKDLLTVSAERNKEEENKTEKFVRREFKFHSFKRSFTLNEKIDTENIEGTYNNGVLTLNLLNKAEVETPAKKIIIQ